MIQTILSELSRCCFTWMHTSKLYFITLTNSKDNLNLFIGIPSSIHLYADSTVLYVTVPSQDAVSKTIPQSPQSARTGFSAVGPVIKITVMWFGHTWPPRTAPVQAKVLPLFNHGLVVERLVCKAALVAKRYISFCRLFCHQCPLQKTPL